MSKIQCVNLANDRAVGAKWERNFCRLAASYGLSFTPMQIGRDKSAQAHHKTSGSWHSKTLPDVTVWTAGGSHHEIKHKSPTKYGSYGLEKYRFEALLWFAGETGHEVYYTIHNHSRCGKHSEENRDMDWFSVDIRDLNGQWSCVRDGNSWVNGQKKRVPIYYWKKELWNTLESVLKLTSSKRYFH